MSVTLNFFINICAPILSLIIDLIALYFTYKSFDLDNNKYDYYTETRILQINPIFYINIENEILHNQINQDDIAYQNKKYISNSLFNVYLLLIFGYIIISYLFMVDFSNLFYSLSKIDLCNIFEKCLKYSTVFIIVYCTGMLLIFTNRSISLSKNIIAMKYYSLKIISDVLLLSMLHYMQINFFWREIYLFSFIFLISIQCIWFEYSLRKSFKIINDTPLIKEKIKRYKSFVPGYLTPLVLYLVMILVKVLEKQLLIT